MFFHHIVITTDLSQASTQAVEFIAKRIPANVERIALLNIIEHYDWPVGGMVGESLIDAKMIEEYNTQKRQESEQKLKDLAAKYFNEANIICVVLSSSNSTAQTICDYAKVIESDLIVVGSHGAGFLENLFLGSTAQKILKYAPCPVLIVPNAGA